MLERKLNSPLTSSMGRLFDAVSAILGICKHSSYDGQAAIELEAAIYDPKTAEPWFDDGGAIAAQRYRFSRARHSEFISESNQLSSADNILINPAPLLKALLDDLKADTPIGIIALRFHNAVVELAVQIAQQAAKAVHSPNPSGRLIIAPTSIQQVAAQHTVVLSGGVFINRYLAEHIPPALTAAGFKVLEHINLPPNDGCISHGQAAVVVTISTT
jgi:hydrogenase maturation protein HypF